MTTETTDLPLQLLLVDPANPRRHVDESDLDDLAASIMTHGVLGRLQVRPTDDGRYGVLSGQRRMLAAARAGLEVVPCEIHHDLDDATAHIVALAAHAGQRDLRPSEEGAALQAMVDAGHTQAAVAAAVGCSQARVSNLIKLLDIDEDLRVKVDAGQMGVTRALATVRRRYDTTHPKPRGRAAQEARQRGPVSAAHLTRHTTANLLGVAVADVTQMIRDGVLKLDPVSGGIPLHSIRAALRDAGPGHEWRRVPTDAWKTIERHAQARDGDTTQLLRAFARGLSTRGAA